MGVRGRTRATGAQWMWGPAGARGSTEGQRPRGPPVRVRGCVPPRCAGARPPPLCACADLREVRARGTRLPGCTARTCWRLSLLRRTPCHTLRRVGRCAGGGRAATKSRDGGARGRPTSVGGGPGSPASGCGRGAGSPCQVSSGWTSCHVSPGRIPWSWKAAMRSSHAGRGCPWGGLAMYTWRPVRWGVSASPLAPVSLCPCGGGPVGCRPRPPPTPLAALRSRPAPGAARLRYRWGA